MYYKRIIWKFLNLAVIIIFLQLSSFITTKSQGTFDFLDTARNPNFYQIKEAWEKYFENIPPKERKGWKQFKRWENFWAPRVYPTGKFPDGLEILKEWRTFNEKHGNNLLSIDWSLLGPVDVPEDIAAIRNQGLGRVNVIRFHPTNSNIYWAGAASGGLWKTNDGGNHWQTFPFTEFLSIGISDIAIAPTNPEVVYVATGDANGTLGTASDFYSIGLIRTTNGGQSWELTNLNYFLHDKKVIGRLLVHPNDYKIIIAATADGIYKSIDMGETWEKKIGGSYFREMEFKPGNPNIIYAATYAYAGDAKIYRSEDGGESWNEVKSLPNCIRLAMAVTPANPNNVYALCAKRDTRGFHSFLKSSDEGRTWDTVAIQETVNNILGWYDGLGNDNRGQGSYDLCLAVSNKDENEIYCGGINIWKSTDGGYSFNIITHYNGDNNLPLVHADHHDLIFQNNSTILFSSNDGGIVKSNTGGKTWSDITDGMSITQFYRIGLSKKDPNFLVGGCQDNGTSMFKNNKWAHIRAADGMECAIDPNHPDTIFASYYYGTIMRSDNGGDYFTPVIDMDLTGEQGAWVTPFLFDPSNNAIMYAGFINVWRSNDFGKRKSWTKISDFPATQLLQSLAVAPSDPNTIYAATYTQLYVTYNIGQSWDLLYSSNYPISYIAVDPTNNKRIWITISNFQAGEKVYEFNSKEMKNISGNLPNIPVNCIVFQNNSPDRLYIGTDIGVFYSDYNSAYWELFGSGLPNVIVNELEIQYSNKKLRAATYGRGVWEANILESNIVAPEVYIYGKTEICQGDSLILEAEDGYTSYHWSNGATSRKIIVKDEGAYSVTVIDKDGNKAHSEAIFVNILAVPDLSIISRGKHPICEGETVQLSAGLGFSSYLWSTGETSRSIVVSEAGDYYVTGKASNNCTRRSDIFTVIVNPIPAKPSISKSGNTLTSSLAFKYQWYFNSDLIEGAENQSYDAQESGKYYVVITDENDCTNKSDEVDIFVGVQDNSPTVEFIKIHPNPGNDFFNLDIKLSAPSSLEITITNILGVRVREYSRKYLSGTLNMELELRNVPAGTYFVTIRFGTNSRVEKIVKE